MLDKAQQAGAESLRLLNELSTHCTEVTQPQRLWSDVRRVCDRMAMMLGADFRDVPLIADVPALSLGRVPIEERRCVAFLVILASGAILAPMLETEGYWEVAEALHEELVTLDARHRLVRVPVPFVVRRPGSAPA